MFGKLIGYIFEPFINFAIQFGYYGEINTEKQDKIKVSISRVVKSSDGKWLPAALSYYMLIAFVPLVSLIILVLTLVPDFRVFIQEQIVNIFPESSETLIEEIFNAIQIDHIELFSLIFLVLASTFFSVRSISALHDMAEYLYGTRKTVTGGSPLIKMLRPLFTLLTIIFFVGLIAAGTLLIPRFLLSPEVIQFVKLPSIVIEVLIFPIQMFIFYHTIIALYKMLPETKVKSSDVRPGAIFFSTTMTIFIIGMTIFINLGFSDYTSIYGSLAIIVVFGTISLAFSFLFFYGMVINVSVKKTMLIDDNHNVVSFFKRLQRTFRHMHRSYGAKSIAKGVKKLGSAFKRKDDPLFDQQIYLPETSKLIIPSDYNGRSVKKVTKKSSTTVSKTRKTKTLPKSKPYTGARTKSKVHKNEGTFKL